MLIKVFAAALSTTLLLGATTLAAPPAEARAITHNLDIPAQDLGTALKALGAAANEQLLFSDDVVKGLRSTAVQGEYSTDEAVALLLKGSGLKADRTPSGVLLIRSAESTGAREGSEEERAQLEEIVVTGSRLKRMDISGPSPVVVISREDIERSGVATTRELLNALSQNGVAADESGNSSIVGASTIQLRGLPVGTTLLLLNGRRLGASAATVSGNFFDLNNIPLGAVERIEVLTDSASAVYGADAIGGAVNVILRQDYEGIGAGVRLGTSAEGDATERNASVTIGGRGEALSGLLVLDVFDRDPYYAADRDLTSTFDFRRFGGPDARSTLAYPANVYSLDFDPVTFETLPLPGLTSSFAAVPSGTDGTGLTIADFQSTQGTRNVFDPAPFASLGAEADRQTVFGSGRYKVSPTLTLFGEGLYTQRDQIVRFPPVEIPFGEFGFVVVPAENPFNPFGVPVGVDYRFLELEREADDSSTDFMRLLAGAEGSLAGRFDWQVYLLADSEHTEIFNRGVVDLAAVQASLDSDTNPQTALNLFSTTRNNNPATLASILNETTDDLRIRARMGEAVLRGPIFELPAGPLNAALGVNVRRERVDFRSPDLTNLLADRDSEAAFVEVAVPLVGPQQNVPAIHSLELTAAVRHDRYSDIDSISSTSPQFGLAWRPLPSLLLRSSYGEAFKAPTVFNLFLPPVGFDAAAADPLRGGELTFFPVTVQGNPELKPEEGESLTAGFVWQPRAAPGFSMSVNAFRLEQKNFITTPGIDQLIDNVDLFPGRVVRAPPGASDPAGFAGRILSIDLSNVNFGSLTVEGADIQLEYAFARTAVGDFVSSFSGTYIDEYSIVLVPGSEPTNEVGHANEAGYPTRFKGNAGLRWDGRGAWSAGVMARYLTSYLDYDGIRELPSTTLFDVQAGYRFADRSVTLLDGLEATLGIINLTDEQGDFSNNFNNTVGYDPQQADIRGRFYYLSLRMKF